jgi:hypothetical protein
MGIESFASKAKVTDTDFTLITIDKDVITFQVTVDNATKDEITLKTSQTQINAEKEEAYGGLCRCK